MKQDALTGQGQRAMAEAAESMRAWGMLLARILCVFLLLAPLTARAGEEVPVQVGVEALTDFPVHVGGKVWLELPHRIRLSTSLGALTGPYADAINAFLVEVNAYDQVTADVVGAALSSSLIWRLHAGWRAVPGYGFYFEAGYGLVTLGGGLSGQDLLAAMLGTTPPATSMTSASYSVSTTLHMVDLEVGWRWVLWRGLTLRAAFGCALTVGAATTVEPNFTTYGMGLVKAFTDMGEAYLDDVFTSYVFTPTVSVAVGWRLWPWG